MSDISYICKTIIAAVSIVCFTQCVIHDNCQNEVVHIHKYTKEDK